MPSNAAVCEKFFDTDTNNISMDISNVISNPVNNIAGYTFEINKNVSAYFQAWCLAPYSKDGYTYRSYVTKFPVAETIGNYQYLKLNDNLEVATSIIDSYAGIFYPPVKFKKMGYDSNSETHLAFNVNDNNFKFSFKIIKPFVGSSSFIGDRIFDVYVTTEPNDPLKSVVYSISYSGTVVVPQSCELDTGKTIDIDFGNIGKTAFSNAGAGNKPLGVNEQTRQIAIQCKNIDAQVLLNLRLEAGDVSGKAIVSDNKDIGFIVGDKNRVPLTPNNIDSKIPFKLNDTGQAEVPITAWPVSITGKAPKEGIFSAQGYLRIDFD